MTRTKAKKPVLKVKAKKQVKQTVVEKHEPAPRAPVPVLVNEQVTTGLFEIAERFEQDVKRADAGFELFRNYSKYLDDLHAARTRAVTDVTDLIFSK